MKKILTFIKDHKREIATTALTIGGTVGIVILIKKIYDLGFYNGVRLKPDDFHLGILRKNSDKLGNVAKELAMSDGDRLFVELSYLSKKAKKARMESQLAQLILHDVEYAGITPTWLSDIAKLAKGE